jgi:modulator of FtsH protease
MFNPRNNSPFGGRQSNTSAYQYQPLPYNMVGTQANGLISKVMALLATSFLVATVASFIGMAIHLTFGPSIIILIAGFVVLMALHAMINKPGWNLALLFLFTFLEGLSIAPIIGLYLSVGAGYIVGQAFLITTVTSLSLAFYAWTAKRSFARLGDYLFVGLILLIVTSLVGLLFHSTFFALLIAFFAVAIFCGYILYYVQRAKYMADTLPNAVGLTVSLFITIMNLFLYILEILSIFQGGGRRR